MTNHRFQSVLTRELAKRKGKKKNGFTLVELLVVVVIIGVLSGVALPNFLKQREKAKVGAANAQAAAVMTACEVAIINDVLDLTADGELSRLVTIAEAAYPAAATDVTMEITVTNAPINDDPSTADVDESADRGCIVSITGTSVDPNEEGSYTSFGTKTAAKAI